MNHPRGGGVLLPRLDDSPMHELADQFAGVALTIDEQLDREFEARVAECARLAVRVAYAVLRNSADAEEAAQEGFAKAYTAFRRLRDRDRFRSWLVRVVWRTAIDRRRADRRRLAREQLHAAHRELSTQPDDAVAKERVDRLWEAVDALPEKLRVVLVLATIEEHNLSEVATLLNVPVGTVKSRLFTARQKMKDLLR
jgi:RNA polymerase sigma-70 factor (ECF subfamily)